MNWAMFPVPTQEAFDALVRRVDALEHGRDSDNDKIARDIGILAKRIDELSGSLNDRYNYVANHLADVERDLDRRVDTCSVRLDALEAARAPTTEPKDCAFLCDNGALLGLMTRAEAERMASVGGGTVLRFAPVEPKP